MTRTLLLFDAVAWRASWIALAPFAARLVDELPPPALEPLSMGLASGALRRELFDRRDFLALPEAQRVAAATLASDDPFLARAPASFWRTTALPAPFDALELRAPILHAKRVDAGDGLSYGHTANMPRDGWVATVGVGYGDGYRRCFSNVGWMRVAGHPVPVAGRVCMDQTLLDLSEHPSPEEGRIGASALAAGGPRREDLGRRSCDFVALAELADLPVHELLGGLGPRVETAEGGASALQRAPGVARTGRDFA